MRNSSRRNKSAYNRPWPTKVACNWNEILRNWLRAHPREYFFSSHRPSSLSSSYYWQKTNSRMVVFQPLFIYIRLFRLHVHFFCAARHLRDAKESKRDTISYYISTSLNCFFFSLFQLFIDWIYLRKYYCALTLHIKQANNRSFLSQFYFTLI